MLVTSRRGRAAAWLIFALLALPVYGLPFAVLVLASTASSWSGVVPHSYTLLHIANGLRGDSLHALFISLVTGVTASAIALLAGTWAALVARRMRPGTRKAVSAGFLAPIAVPSVVVGLSVLTAFSRPPLLLSGYGTIVVLAHVVIVTAFAYQAVSAALTRLDPGYLQIAASLGAHPGYVLRRVTLPLLSPALVAAAGLCFALSMGELGATIMVYPPDWATLPVWISGLADRGQLFDAAALTLLLLAATVAALSALSLIRTRAARR